MRGICQRHSRYAGVDHRVPVLLRWMDPFLPPSCRAGLVGVKPTMTLGSRTSFWRRLAESDATARGGGATVTRCDLKHFRAVGWWRGGWPCRWRLCERGRGCRLRYLLLKSLDIINWGYLLDCKVQVPVQACMGCRQICGGETRAPAVN